MLRRDTLICGLLLWGSSHAAPPSTSGAGKSRSPVLHDDSKPITQARKLTGRFLHITGTLATYPVYEDRR
jgi:endopolyphosphatase